MRASGPLRAHPVLTCLQSRAAAMTGCLALLGLCVFNFVELGGVSSGSSGSEDDTPPPLHLTANVPAWVSDPQVMARFTPAGGREFPMVDVESSLIDSVSKAQGQEDLYAYTQFFFQRGGGTFLEFGALDGIRYSNTFGFDKALGWHGVHIEASPSSFELLALNRPEQLDIHVAVCDQPRVVHYADTGNPAVRGVVEFMSQPFLQKWHKKLNPANLTGLPEVQCQPLAAILRHYGITHINFFVLDVEGAELVVLQAVDFSQISFDVIVIEADHGDLPKEQGVKDLLASHGYSFFRHVRRNDWFVRAGFVPSKESDAAFTGEAPRRPPMTKPEWASDKQAMAKFTQDGGSSWQESKVQPRALRARSTAQDWEDVYAYCKFFYQRAQGTFLEMGALDGDQFSNTKAMESVLQWRGVHIEASPASYKKLAANRPDQINVHVAVCDRPHMVHYVDDSRAPVRGIYETMSQDFLKQWYPHLMDEKATEDLPEVLCLPLDAVLNPLGIWHVNFFVLDVEGAELAVLKAIDFSRLSFDVLCVEADGMSPEKDAAVVDLLVSKGYAYHGHVRKPGRPARIRRNDWFVREGFEPSAAPEGTDVW